MAVSSAEITRFLRDFSTYNILLASVQFTSDDIIDAKKFAISEFNAMTPMTNFNEATFPNDWILLLGICSHLMQSESFLQLRNQVTYQDGGVGPIGIDDKYTAYVNLKNDLKNEWATLSRAVKTQQNMESAYDSLSSGYRFIRTGTRTS
jgi:hypothetical protein